MRVTNDVIMNDEKINSTKTVSIGSLSSFKNELNSTSDIVINNSCTKSISDVPNCHIENIMTVLDEKQNSTIRISNN